MAWHLACYMPLPVPMVIHFSAIYILLPDFMSEKNPSKYICILKSQHWDWGRQFKYFFTEDKDLFILYS